ncbi:MAG: hypothetical protein ACWGQW_06485 [bacterium]
MTNYPVAQFEYREDIRRNRKREPIAWRGAVLLGDVEVFVVNEDVSRYTLESPSERIKRLEYLFAYRLAEVLEEE